MESNRSTRRPRTRRFARLAVASMAGALMFGVGVEPSHAAQMDYFLKIPGISGSADSQGDAATLNSGRVRVSSSSL